jgi:NADH-quinone oxidoreductase subunit A
MPPALPGYVPVAILFLVAVGFAVFAIAMSHALGRPRSEPGRTSTYECGIPPVGTAGERFPVKFYLVAMVFILIDVDAAFLYPWALIFRQLGLLGLVEMALFVALLGAGFVYAWKTGVLEW